jgi:nitrate reductase assembly molybdenum cofactor insertion protein NarJ
MGRKNAEAALISTAAEWRLISLLLQRPRAGWLQEVNGLAQEVRDERTRAAAAAARDATEGEYLRLVGPGGVVSPREVTFQPFQDPGRLLAQLATAYSAFAFHPRTEDPIDHVAVEADFVGYLLLKEAFAAARGDAEAAATTAAARASFVETHLAPLAATFVQRLESAGPSYLLAAAHLLAARVPACQPVRLLPSAGDALAACAACGGSEAY